MSLSRDQQRAAISLGADMAAARFARECRAEGLRWLLLKGPSIASRLYADDELRPYVDLDVLVAPGDYPRAEAVLARLGYREAPHLPRQRVEHASPWRAPRRVPVDLHRRIPHIPADPDLVWDILIRDALTIRVASEDVEVVSLHALALLVALHALHHGASLPKPLMDLSLAATRLPLSTWRGAHALALALGAERNLAAALTFTSASRAINAALGLPRQTKWEVALRSSEPARLSAAFKLLQKTRGFRSKMTAFWGELRPSDEVETTGTSSRGGRARVPTRIRRVLLFARAAPAALLAWLVELNDVRKFEKGRTKASSSRRP